MAVERSKYKGASVNANKELTKTIESKTGSSNPGRAGFHSIDDGINVFRICPPHDPNDPSMEACCVSQLKCMVDEYDSDNKKTGKKVLKTKKIFNSRIHAEVAKDLVEEYIKLVKKEAYETIQDEKTRQKRLNPISGWRGLDGKWNWGIQPMTSFVMYAFKDGKIGRLEISKSEASTLEKLNISEDANEPITTDVFSDPDEGISLIINRMEKVDSTGKKKKENILSKREFNPKKFKTWAEFIESERITDEQLEIFAAQEPLKSLYRNSFTRKDFNFQLEALQIFDAEHKYNIFDNPDFIATVEEISAMFPEVEEPESSENEVSIDDMTREELKAYIEEKELNIVVKKAMSDEDIRDLIREEEQGDVVENESTKEEPKKEEKVVEKQTQSKVEEKSDLPWDKEGKETGSSTTSGMSVKDRLAALRAKNADK